MSKAARVKLSESVHNILAGVRLCQDKQSAYDRLQNILTFKMQENTNTSRRCKVTSLGSKSRSKRLFLL